MEDKVYDLNIFEVEVQLRFLVTASNSRHALQRSRELFKGRITQYVHPDDTPPNFKVIAVCRNAQFATEPKRLEIVSEGYSARSEIHTKTASEESSL